MRANKSEALTCVGLFAGIGGIELGLSRAGHHTKMICEIDAGAVQVLQRQFKMGVELDIRRLGAFPKVDLIAAGFPCQDLSQAGRTAGIRGKHSGLVAEVFKRVRTSAKSPRWLLFENVPFMLHLERGKAMRYLVDELEQLGFMWAYRVVDARAFGLPQRRKRVLLLASRCEDPRAVLFGVDAGKPSISLSTRPMFGFYWTEGLRGLGWAIDSLPTLKGGSTIGIPSPPAMWDPEDGSLSTLDIRDAERLQGFKADWTAPACDAFGIRRSHRWKLVGNAVSVPVAEWLGRRLTNPSGAFPAGVLLAKGASLPPAAWGHNGAIYSVDVSTFPVRRPLASLRDFLRFPRKPLSHRAASGFLRRADQSGLNFDKEFIKDVRKHVRRMADCEV